MLGYRFISELRRRHGSDIVQTRVLGIPVICMGGPDAVRLFYDESRFQRGKAIPPPVKRTLFGVGGVQSLDNSAHRLRKSLFMQTLTPAAVNRLVQITAAQWDQAVNRWTCMPSVTLFHEAALVFTQAVTRWACVPLPAAGARELARNLTAMVDGFGSLGPRNWRARRARSGTQLWAGKVVRDVRDRSLTVPGDSIVYQVATHRGPDGDLLPEPAAAVELLNIIRPTVAVAWFVSFTAHALHRYPQWKETLGDGGDERPLGAFAQEIRRFYPFAPFLGARVRDTFTWRGRRFPRGRTVLLDLYGTDHDPAIWEDPESFDPQRFMTDTAPDWAFVPQGGGDAHTGHRCPGEDITLRLIMQASTLLSRLDYHVPHQDLAIPLDRMPTKPRSGLVITQVRQPVTHLTVAGTA